MQHQIGPFRLYTKKPNDIQYGHIYTMNVILPVGKYQNRTVRVYLPEGYDKNKRYPVMYMSDGQNIVDKYTTAYGAWDIDIRQHELIKEGYTPFIVVGLDCPKSPTCRVQEYTFMDVPILDKYISRRARNKRPYSDKIMDYFVNQIKPLVDQYFSTRKEKEWTAFGGSSMGGIASFNMATTYHDVFGFSLCFSPAFHLYDPELLTEYVDSLNINPEEYGKFFFYSGGVEFENSFLKPTMEMYSYMLYRGFTTDQVSLLIDTTQKHCEAAWSLHFNEAIRFWLKDYALD